MNLKNFLIVTSLVLGFANVSQAQVSTLGVVGHFPFTGNANDISSKNNHGIASNVILTSDRFGQPNQAYSFNGINSSVVIPEMYDLPSRTISLWFNASTIDYNSRIIYTSDNNSLQYGITSVEVIKVNGTNKVRAALSGTLLTVNITANSWNNLVVSVGTDSTFLYLNGIKVQSALRSNYTHSYQGRQMTIIGEPRYSGSPSLNFIGKIDDVVIYNYQLNHTEVLAIYQQNLVNTLKEEVSLNEIIISPNPTPGEVTIHFPSGKAGKNHIIKVLDNIGKTVEEIEVHQLEDFAFTLPEFLPKGFYIIQVTNSSGQILVNRRLLLE